MLSMHLSPSMAKILIIDDDPAVRQYLATLVARLGHDALTKKRRPVGGVLVVHCVEPGQRTPKRARQPRSTQIWLPW